MKEIKLLVEQIGEELEGSEKYAKLANQYRDTDTRLADVYIRLAEQEMAHTNTLHEQARRLISESTQEPPAAMLAVWNWEHDKMLEHMSKIKMLINMYKN